MAVQRNTFGYRDPHKAMTLKALQDRAAAAQTNFAASQTPEQISSPWQGAANVLGTLGAGMGARRAEREEAEGRSSLARIMAGVKPQEASEQQLAEIGMYDPELAAALRKERVDKLTHEDTQAFTTSERVGTQEYQTGIHEDTQAETARLHEDTQAEGRTTAATLAETNKITAATLAGTQATAAEELAREQEKSKERESQLSTESGNAKIMQDWREGKFNDTPEQDINDPIVVKRREDALAAEQIKGTPTPAAGSDYTKKAEQVAAERHGKIVDQGNNAKYFISDIKRLGELGKSIGTGKEEEIKVALGPWAEMVGLPIEGLDEAQAYKAIADRLAPQMRPEGSGSSSNYDAQQFLRSLPSLGATVEGNKIIEDTFTAIEQTKISAAQIAQRALLPPGSPGYLPWQEVDAQIAALPDPFELYKKASGGGTPAGDTGGAEGPVFDPEVDKEGDTGEDDQGNPWKVIGGKWVIQQRN